MIVRDATADDHTCVMELLRHLNSDDTAPDTHASLNVFNSILASQHFKVLVIEHEGLVAGTCYLNIIPNLTRGLSPYAVIENVVTLPQFRKLGLGKKLMQSAISRAFDEGCYKVMLLTGRGDGVQAFYKQCGMDADSKQAFIARRS